MVFLSIKPPPKDLDESSERDNKPSSRFRSARDIYNHLFRIAAKSDDRDVVECYNNFLMLTALVGGTFNLSTRGIGEINLRTQFVTLARSHSE